MRRRPERSLALRAAHQPASHFQSCLEEDIGARRREVVARGTWRFTSCADARLRNRTTAPRTRSRSARSMKRKEAPPERGLKIPGLGSGYCPTDGPKTRSGDPLKFH